MFQKLYTLYREMDASIVEINPLVVTDQGALVALDAKMNLIAMRCIYILM